MMKDDAESSLTASEREALLRWVSPAVPLDFADRVTEVWMEECRRPVATVIEPDASSWRRSTLTMLTALAALAAALVVWMVSASWVGRRSDPEEIVASELARHREDARTVLLERCQPCHDGRLAGQDEHAIAVFDLNHPNWWASLSERQVVAVHDKLVAMRGATPHERGRVSDFVDAELASRRGAGGSPRPRR